ncbi:MAG: hypothetical protein KBB52_03200 [Candidatus Omnitrophica bacterium]|nr:hypothetical protein [Candidatus Omnitrophota bacterium]
MKTLDLKKTSYSLSRITPDHGIYADPFFNSSLYSFSLALTLKDFYKLAAQEFCAMIQKRGGLDFKKERLLCKEKFSALSNDFENIFVKKFMKRYQTFKNVFKKRFLENFETAQNVFFKKIFCVKDFQKNVLDENCFSGKVSSADIMMQGFPEKSFEENPGTVHAGKIFLKREDANINVTLRPQANEVRSDIGGTLLLL